MEDKVGNLFLVSYDVIKNSPSGRRLEYVTSGIDLWRISKEKNHSLSLVAESLPLGGIDTVIYGSINEKNGNIHLAGGNVIYTIKSTGKILPWKVEQLSLFEIVEIAFENDRAAAILRKKHDGVYDGAILEEHSNYYVGLMDCSGAIINPIKEIGIPWGICRLKGVPVYRLAKTGPEYIQVFNYDLNRMWHGGIMEYGANNLEGRIAWSQVYYLHGLLSILSGQVPHLAPDKNGILQRRVKDELQLVISLSEKEYPGYRVKRYSIDREPLLFALHLGRIATLLVRSQKMKGLFIPGDYLEKIQQEMLSLQSTVEEKYFCIFNQKRLPYLKYRTGYPFWADGANVPYNYVSGYVEGLLMLAKDKVVLKWLCNLLDYILLNEFNNKLPYLWRYWGGVGDIGWQEDSKTSLNTLSYSGNKNAYAHISYRTMDARALIVMFNLFPKRRLLTLINHFRFLVENGWLYPSLNELLSIAGNRVTLNEYVCKRYARSSSVSDIQNQVWAIDQLIAELDYN